MPDDSKPKHSFKRKESSPRVTDDAMAASDIHDNGSPSRINDEGGPSTPSENDTTAKFINDILDDEERLFEMIIRATKAVTASMNHEELKQPCASEAPLTFDKDRMRGHLRSHFNFIFRDIASAQCESFSGSNFENAVVHQVVKEIQLEYKVGDEQGSSPEGGSSNGQSVKEDNSKG